MDLETLLVVAALVAVTLPLTLKYARQSASRPTVLAVWGLAALGLAWVSAAYAPANRAPILDRPVQLDHDGYVSSDSCQACHPREYGTWHASYHRTMTQPGNVDTVLGPIDGQSIVIRGENYRLQRRGREVWVEMPDPDWSGEAAGKPRVWRQIVQTTGSHEEQFYWIASGLSRKLSLLPFMYRLLDEQRWAPLKGCCITPPNMIQEAGTGRWNRVCNRCHATHALPGIRSTEEMDTHVAELGIACEACHGPGLEHTEANRNPRRRYANHLDGEHDTTIINPEHLTQEQSAQTCGQCHGIHVFRTERERLEWRERGFRFRPGQDLNETRELKKDGADKFWSDGMVRVSGREYNGLVESPCYQRGEMTCLDCHVMHQAEDDERPLEEWTNDQLLPGMQDDAACLQCHQELEGESAIAEHSFHTPGTAGASCMNCHMPYTTYGLLKAIRSHEVSSPSAGETMETGRPNACNACHLDRTLAWTAEQLTQRYGIEAPDLPYDERTTAAGVLWTVKGDAGVRALAAWYMGWEDAREASGSDWLTPFLVWLMRDEYDAVRVIAHRSFAKQPEANTIQIDPYGLPLGFETATAPAYGAWAASGGSRRGREDAAAFLFDATGVLDTKRLEAMMETRDTTPITLNE